MERSEQIGKFAEALAKAQGAIKAAVKGKENPFYKSSYADLPRIVEACREQLSKNNIAYIQSTQFDGDLTWIETMLAHSSDQWVSSRYPVRPVKADPQGLGSAMTYARRYALAALVGVVAEDEDDDANVASGKHAPGTGHSDPLPPLDRPKQNGDPRAAAIKWASEAEKTIKAFTKITDLRAWEVSNGPAVRKLESVDRELHDRIFDTVMTRYNDLKSSTLTAG